MEYTIEAYDSTGQKVRTVRVEAATETEAVYMYELIRRYRWDKG